MPSSFLSPIFVCSVWELANPFQLAFVKRVVYEDGKTSYVIKKNQVIVILNLVFSSSSWSKFTFNRYRSPHEYYREKRFSV